MTRAFANIQPILDVEALLRQISPPSVASELSVHVKACFEEARTHRISSGVEKMMLDGLRAYKCLYNPEDIPLLENPNEVYIGITNLKCRALQAWVSDLILQAEEKPWTLTPTPVPELPPRLEQIVISRLAAELEVGGFAPGVTIEDVAAKAKTIALDFAQEMAADATARMEDKIADQFEQGGWRSALEECVIDLSVYPNMVLKGPVMRRVKRMRWNNDKVQVADDMQFVYERVSPLDFYPAPNSKTTQDGAYVIQRVAMTQDDLIGSIGIHGCDEVAIRRLVAENPEGMTSWLNDSPSERDGLTKTDTAAASPSQSYHVLSFHGKVSVQLLIASGVLTVGDLPAHKLDMHGVAEAEIWVCGSHVLRAILNPYPLQRRPYSSSPYQPEPGSFWGRSLPSIMSDVQRLTNATARAMTKNMAFSAGPIGEYDQERMVHEKDMESIIPYRMFAVKSDPFGSQTSAIRFQRVENVTYRFLQAYEMFKRDADDASGIPAYALGQPQTAGAGRTLGGLSMLMGNAAKGVKRVVSLMDKGIVEPTVQMQYMLNLIYSDDETIKADAAVSARGSSGLLQRELSRQQTVEVLQMLSPYVPTGAVTPMELRVVIRDAIKALGYQVEGFMEDPKRQQYLQTAAAQVGAAPQPNVFGSPGQVIPQIGQTPSPQQGSPLEQLRSMPATGGEPMPPTG